MADPIVTVADLTNAHADLVTIAAVANGAANAAPIQSRLGTLIPTLASRVANLPTIYDQVTGVPMAIISRNGVLSTTPTGTAAVLIDRVTNIGYQLVIDNQILTCLFGVQGGIMFNPTDRVTGIHYQLVVDSGVIGYLASSAVTNLSALIDRVTGTSYHVVIDNLTIGLVAN